MSATGPTDRVTNKQLYDELQKIRKEFPSRREMYLVIAIAVATGTGIGSAIHPSAIPTGLHYLSQLL